MNAQPIATAARAKGKRGLLRRLGSISSRYGLTSTRFIRALDLFVETLGRFECGASFPVTTVTLQRHAGLIEHCADRNIELAVHGYRHVDYAGLTPKRQLDELRRSREIFARLGLAATGFRSPYLSRNPELYEAVAKAGFAYVSNQPLVWEVLDLDAFGPSARASYERAIEFYDPWFVRERPSLPHLRDRLVEIPVSLPDDEILLDRVGGPIADLVDQAWRSILLQSFHRGELFTLQLHPERALGCAKGLATVLTKARALSPPVWCARLDEIADWWRARAGAKIEVTQVGDGEWQLTVDGPPGTTVLARQIEADVPVSLWGDGYQQLQATAFVVRSSRRPFIGLSPSASPDLASFLRQQGYIVETSEEGEQYSYFFGQKTFEPEDERPLLAKIEETGGPLVRLSRWPNRARSALAVTGDVDAVTWWDYGRRFLGG